MTYKNPGDYKAEEYGWVVMDKDCQISVDDNKDAIILSKLIKIECMLSKLQPPQAAEKQ